MAAPRRPTPVNADDLEQTAELPVIDFSARENERAALDATARVPALDLSDDSLARTDVYNAPVLSGAARLADNLRDVEERLHRHAERAAALERELETVRAEHELALREARTATARAETQLAASEHQAGETAERLTTATARLAEVEEALATRERELAVRERRLDEVQREFAQASGLARELGLARDELAVRAEKLDAELSERIAQLGSRESELARATSLLRDQERRLGALVAERDELRARSERQLEALHRAQGRRDVVAALVAEHHAELAAQEQRFTGQAGEIESRLATERAAVERLNQELESLRAAHAEELRTLREANAQALEQQRTSLLQESEAERGELERSHEESLARARAGHEGDLAAQADEHREVLARLQSELGEAIARSARAEEDLRAAEERLRQLEAEQRHREARNEELSRDLEELQARHDEARRLLGERDDRLRQLGVEAQASAAMLRELQQSIQRLSRDDGAALPAAGEAAQESLARLLVRTDGDGEVVHVLGRRTSIGRTPDNDIRLDAHYVSRHHAVLLTSPQHTIIEDLNSTNGVLVNGRRVSRQPLHDGDAVAIGNAHFRFELRPVASGSEVFP